MKKIVLTLAALAAFTGSAMAADMAPRYTKAPVPMPVAPNWTGFYIFGGGGGGLWAPMNTPRRLQAASAEHRSAPGRRRLVRDGRCRLRLAGQRRLGRRHLRRRSVRQHQGHPSGSDVFGLDFSEKMQDAWAAGARVGYLVAPNVLSYVNGGYSGSHWSGSTFLSAVQRRPGGRSYQLVQPQWLVHRRRRREQPEHLRHHGAWLVHEDRVPLGFLQLKNSRTGRRHQCPRRRDITFKPGSRPSAPRWSTASTGAARWLRSTDLG